MKPLLNRICLFSGYFTLFCIFFLLLIAYSTRFVPDVEAYCFSQPWMVGGTYMRTQHMDEWLQEDDNKPSGLLLGGSTVYRNIDPYVMSEETGVDFFNAGSSSQALVNSAVLLKYCVSRGKVPRHVVLSIDPVLWGNNGHECSGDWLINERNPTKRYMFEMVALPRKPGLLIFYFYRLIKHYIPNTREYLNTEVENNEQYIGKGFVCSSNDEKRLVEAHVQATEITNKNYEAFREIKAICKRKQINLVLFYPKLLNVSFEKEEIKRLEGDLLDASDAPIDSLLFYDNYHLYCKGTSAYTKWIAAKFLDLSKQKTELNYYWQ